MNKKAEVPINAIVTPMRQAKLEVLDFCVNNINVASESTRTLRGEHHIRLAISTLCFM